MAVRGDNSLYFSTGLDNSGLQGGIDNAVGMVQNMAGTIASINPFLALSVGAAAAFGVIANESYKMMKEFESAMTEVKTIANVTESEFKDLENQVFSLYKQLGTESPAALANGLYDIIGAGYEASDALKLLEISSKAATAGVTTSAVASDGLTTILNAFKLEATDASRVADIMFATVDRGKISFEELSRQIAQVAPLAAASGFSFEEIGGAISTLTKQGVPAAQAMTQIRSAIEATNEVLGDGVAKSMTLQNAFQLVYDQAGGSQNKLKELTGRVEAVNGVLAIAGPNFKGAAEDLEAMGNAAGSVDRSFEMITGTTANEWEIFGERIQATTEKIGKSVLKMSNSLAGALNDALDSTEDLNAELDREADKVQNLYDEYIDTNTETERRNEILKELNQLHPGIVSGIDAEADSYEELTKRVKAYNEELVFRRAFEDDLNAAKELREERAELEAEMVGLESDLRNHLKSFRRNFSDSEWLEATGYSTLLDHQKKEINDILYSNLDDLEKIKQVNQRIEEFVSPERRRATQRRKGGLANVFPYIGSSTKGEVGLIEKELNETNDRIREITDKIDQENREYYDNQQRAHLVIAKVNTTQNEEELEEYESYTNEMIKKAVERQQGLFDVINKIKSFTREDYQENGNLLDQYLYVDVDPQKLSRNDKKIKEVAEQRLRWLNTDYTPTVSEDTGFADMLEDREKQYKEYYAVVNQLGKEAADKQYQNLLKEGEDYGKFLQNQIDKTNSFSQKRDIALAAEKAGINLQRPIVDTVNELGKKPIILDVEIDETSINFIRNKISLIQEELNAANEVDRPEIQERLDYWEKRLEATRSGTDREESLYGNLRRGLEDLNNNQLRDYIKYWKDRLKEAKKGSEAEQEALSNIKSAETKIGENTADTLREISGSLGEASQMFRKFGEEDLADTLDKLSEVGSGIASAVAGFTTGGPLGIIQGAMGVFSAVGSLLSGNGNSGKSALEKSIDSLNRSIDRLKTSFDYIYGAEAQAARATAEQQTKELIKEEEKRLNFALSMFEALKNDGIGGNKFWLNEIGFEGTLDDLTTWIEDQRDAVDGLKKDLADLQGENNEYFTGSTSESITDAILTGLAEGKRGLEDFAQTFEDLMKQAMLSSFKNKFLAQEMEKFHDAFADASEDGLSKVDIDQLAEMYGKILEGSEDYFEGFNRVLESAGMDPFGSETSQNRQGMTGAISSITEDTANVLGGYMNAIRLDVRQSLAFNEQSMQHLEEIAANTRYNRYLESIDSRMATIEKGMHEFGAQG